jgi:CDP-diglyceride synthetase
MKTRSNWQIRLLVGLIAGAIIVYIDNFAFQGEVSPIVIVMMLLVSTITFGAIWKWQAWIAALAIWICVPMAHVVKHLLGLPDTLHPNTYPSILLLALFTLVVSAIGFFFGTFLHGISKGTPRRTME